MLAVPASPAVGYRAALEEDGECEGGRHEGREGDEGEADLAELGGYRVREDAQVEEDDGHLGEADAPGVEDLFDEEVLRSFCQRGSRWEWEVWRTRRTDVMPFGDTMYRSFPSPVLITW